MSLFDHVLVPVASEKDATATIEALRPHLADVSRITALHVIEKGGGSPDKAPMEKRRADADEFLGVLESRLGDSVAVESRIGFGTSIVDTIFEEAAAVDATAVAFRPRDQSRIVRLIVGDTTRKLVVDPAVPVVSLPAPTDV